MENLDNIITIVRIWPNDPCINCMPNKTMKDYLKVKGHLVYENYELFEETKYFGDMNVNGDWHK